MINQNEEIKIGGQIKDGSLSVNVVDFEFYILFVDVDNTLYKQRVRRFGNGGSYKIDNPEEVTQ